MLPHAEEIVFLGDPGDRPAAVRALFALDILFRPEALVGDAVPALVGVLVDFPPVVEAGKNALDHLHMPLLGRPDEIVVRYVELTPEILEALDHPVAVLQRGDACGGGGLLHFLPVLVGAGEEEDILSPETVEARQAVGDDGRVGVPQVGDVIHVIDRRRNVEVLLFRHDFRSSKHPTLPKQTLSVKPAVSCQPSAFSRGHEKAVSCQPPASCANCCRSAFFLLMTEGWLPGFVSHKRLEI